jgi:hypothetical protein
MAIDLNPILFGRKLFPSSQRTGDFFSKFGQSVAQAFTPAAGTPPATMAGVSIPPAGASLSQLQFKGPLLGTGSMFGIRGAQQPAPQPAQPSFDYGTYAATRGFPSFDVTKIQTPFSQASASAPQQVSSALATPLPSQAQAPIQPYPPMAITEQASRPAAGFARISDWSQNPLVQAARATGDVSALARATEQARNQGRSALAPKDIFGVSLAALRESNPEAGFGTSRTPEQQQELLAQVRQNGGTIAKNIQSNLPNSMTNAPEQYRAFSGRPVALPTNMFGQPIASFKEQMREEGRLVDRSAPSQQFTPRLGGPILMGSQRPSPYSANPQPTARTSPYSNRGAEARKLARSQGLQTTQRNWAGSDGKSNYIKPEDALKLAS